MGRLGSYPAPAHSRLPYQKRRGYNGPNEGLAVACKYSPTIPESLGNGWEKEGYLKESPIPSPSRPSRRQSGCHKEISSFGLTSSVPVYERYIREKGTECGGGGYGEAGRLNLKGQCHEIFCFWFFHGSVSPQPQSIPLRPFRIFSKIRGDIRGSRFATGVNDTGGKWKKSSIRKI